MDAAAARAGRVGLQCIALAEIFAAGLSRAGRPLNGAPRLVLSALGLRRGPRTRAAVTWQEAVSA
jgi:hypothetical protein